MPKRLDAGYVNRSVVCDPGGPQDFFDHVEPLLPRAVRSSFKESECVEDQKAVIDAEVIPHLQEIAPEGCVFGRNPFYTDCSDWGFWQTRMPLPQIQVFWGGGWSTTIALPNGKRERLCYHRHRTIEAARRCGTKRLRARLARFKRQANEVLRRRVACA